MNFPDHDYDYEELRHAGPDCTDYLVVNWRFHTICNYTCSYCPSFLNDGSRKGLELDIILQACDRLIAQSSRTKYFFEFTGGEITYYRKFSELLQELKKRNVEVGLISNGSRDLKWWLEHRSLIDHICLSFHPEQGSKEHFSQVVALLNETMKVHVNIMMLPEKFSELHDYASVLAATISGITISMQPLLENLLHNMYPYTIEQQQILNKPELPWGSNLKHFPRQDKKNQVYRGAMIKSSPSKPPRITDSTELIARQENKWTFWSCWAGIENIAIDEEGRMYRGWCRQGGCFGHVSQEFTLPDLPVLCLARQCSCGMDIMSTKKKNYQP